MNDCILDQNSLFCSSLYATHMLEAVKRTKIKEVILHFAPHTEELQRQKTETNKMCVTRTRCRAVLEG
ncbi:hypothetical protein MUK42_23080 [Musa troglodytarum]|uniref:Uncharacterized protein n=1 Tax=Musa troglodytarum TaxID=320322 RepID=A0A9E7GCR1_9LILI|nr:hypothetical protein MUK42_23080 [Musa troglodytarum]